MNRKLQDSGERRTFASGAVRDRGGTKPRPDLISPHAAMREGMIFALGAEKYSVRNWEKGIEISECLASAIRHIEKYKRGDTDEDHLAMARWNLGAMIHFEEEIKAGRMDPAIDDMPHYTTRPQRLVMALDNDVHVVPDPGTEIMLKGESDRFLHQLGRPTFYVAGPMRGIHQYNFPAFDDTTKRARARGWLVISPSDLDRGQGLDPVNDPEGVAKAIADPKILQRICKRDCNAILALEKDRGDGLIILDGWQNSTGARAEIALALWMELKFRAARTLLELPNHVVANKLFYQKDGARG